MKKVLVETRHLHGLVHKAIIDREFFGTVIVAASGALDLLQWLFLKVQYTHAEDVGLTGFPPPLFVFDPVTNSAADAHFFCGSGSRQKSQCGSGSMNFADKSEQNTSIRDLTVIIPK
jgi:hypothetical protein